MRAFLYDEARLERRYRLFEGICLPSLAAQSDSDFAVAFLVSNDLPKTWRKRLDRLLAPHPWAQVIERPAMNHYPAITEAFAEVPGAGYTHRTTFRLDDDDAVGLDYIKTLRSLCDRLRAIPAEDVPIGIAFNKGLYLTYSKQGTEYHKASERTPLSVGTALMAPVGFDKNIYAYNHRALGQFHDTWLDQGEFQFLRTLHQDNKSNPHFSGAKDALPDQRAASILKRKFGLDKEKLDALMRGA